MQYKHRLLLSLAQELNLPLDNKLQYIIHSYKHIADVNYEFTKNEYSFELENDIKYFKSKADFENNRYAKKLTIDDKLKIANFNSRMKKGEVFEFEKFITKEKQENKILFTIGYEGKSIDSYINQLIQNHISYLVDVRRNAYSNKFGFKKKELSGFLDRIKIKYIHIPELGINSEKRQEAKVGAYKNNNNLPLFGNPNQGKLSELFIDYKENLPTKQEYIEELKSIIEKYKLVAITCFEAKYTDCHRHILANFLNDIKIVHL